MQKISLKAGIAAGSLLLGSALTSCDRQEEKDARAEDPRPNIVLFFTDDNAFTYWGFGGGPDLSPRIDGIRAAGLEATEFYCSASVCTPSRYSLHTGKFAGRSEHPEFVEAFPEDEPYNIIWNTFLDGSRETTMGDILREAGYFTGFVGKWHLGFDRSPFQLPGDADPFDPEVDKVLKEYQSAVVEHVKKEGGFDFAASIVPQNNDDNFVDALQYHNLEWYAKGAMDFIDHAKREGRPYFLIVNITTHHGPCHTESIESDIRITQAGVVEGLEKVMPERSTIYERIMEKGYPVDFKTAGTLWTDDCVGSILDYLERKKVNNNTAVIFTTDHNRFDGKATCYQGGVHIPFVMQWPGVIEPGSTTNKRMMLTDLLPTFAEMAGSRVPDTLEIDGRSRMEWLMDPVMLEDDDETLFFEFGYTRAVISGKWKYIAYRLPEDKLKDMKNNRVSRAWSIKGMLSDEPCIFRYPHYFDADQLYNLEEDPDEQVNLAYDAEYDGIVLQMQETLKNYTATFRNVFEIKEPDPFYTSSEYRELAEKARQSIDMDQFYWYRKGCY